MNEHIYDIRWVPNSHYSGVHGLLKLLFPKIIPLTITKKIIILDTDMTIVDDIYRLWNLFSKFNKYQVSFFCIQVFPFYFYVYFLLGNRNCRKPK